MGTANLNLLGLHFHLGSLVFETEPYELAIELILRFAQEMKEKFGFQLSELSVGGGFAVQYTLERQALPPADYARAITDKLNSLISLLGLVHPRLVIEPGRAIVGQAGVALYTVGAIKEIPGVREYVCVDGGMSDNIRPALYGARYEALVANKASEAEGNPVTIAGKLCESGDLLATDVKLAQVCAGDIIAMPVCGAYSIPMSSNYNVLPRPAIVMIDNGKARLTRRRESYQDLMRLDVI